MLREVKGSCASEVQETRSRHLSCMAQAGDVLFPRVWGPSSYPAPEKLELVNPTYSHEMQDFKSHVK